MAGIGIAAIALGLVLWLLRLHVARRKAWDRPRFTLSPAYPLLAGPLTRALLFGGIIVLGMASPRAALLTGGLLLALWAWLAWIRSAHRAKRRLQQAFAAGAAEGAASAREHACAIVLDRHPEWGRELVERMVADHPRSEDLARIVVRMEKRWPS